MSLNNSNVIDIINPIDGNYIKWNNNDFASNNWPDVKYQGSQKKTSLKYILKKNQNIIDTGAHIGDYGVPLACALRNLNSNLKVYCIEPSKKKCIFIEEMCSLNNLNNLQVINLGLSNKEEAFSVANCGSGGLITNGKNTGAWQWITDFNGTKFSTLDKLYENKIIENIGFIWLDVQWMEKEVLEGGEKLIKNCKPYILMEYWPVSKYASDNKTVINTNIGTINELKNDIQFNNVFQKLNIKISDLQDSDFDDILLESYEKTITYNNSWSWNKYKKDEKNNFDYRILDTYKTNKQLIRVGPKHDGGYVIVKDICYDLYLTCGIAGNTCFDNTIMDMYPHLKTYGFDGYIDKVPSGTNKNLKFIKKNINNIDDDKNTTLKEYFSDHNNILLQIDIEGSEFTWLDCLSTNDISKFSQILIEVHWPFDNFRYNALKKLDETHYLVHIHGNNYCNRDFPDKDIGRSYDGTIFIDNPGLQPIHLPEVMELTYIRKNLVSNVEKVNYNFPRNFDSRNNRNAKDIEFNIPNNDNK
jgi:FkbM family methyltransferase